MSIAVSDCALNRVMSPMPNNTKTYCLECDKWQAEDDIAKCVVKKCPRKPKDGEDEEDFLSDSQACGIAHETCESCQ